MSASLSTTATSKSDEQPVDDIRHMIDYMRAFTQHQSPERTAKDDEDGAGETSEESRRSIKFKGRASSADDRSLERQAKRARISLDHTTDLDTAQDNEELRTSWMDVRPSTGDVEARSSSQNSFLANTHARRFTVDSLARPEELLASLLHQPHSSHHHHHQQQQQQHRQLHNGTSLLTSPSSHSALMPTLSQSPDENVNWLSSPFEDDRGDSFLEIPPPGMSARSWTDVEGSLKHPPSLTSTSEVGSLDNSEVPNSVSQFLQHPRHLAWIQALRKGEQVEKSVPSSSTAKDKPTSTVDQVPEQPEVHPLAWVPQSIHLPVWQQKSMTTVGEAGLDGRAQPCSKSFDELLTNIATSICHQTNAAAVAASAFQQIETSWPSSLHLRPATNRPILTTGPATFPPHDGIDAPPSSQMADTRCGAATSASKQQATSTGDTGLLSTPRIKREGASSPSNKKTKKPARQKVNADTSSQGIKEQMTKQEREQRRLADRRRRRRESHNAVERRRRDLINERIAELATLLPEIVLMEAIAHSTSGGTAPHIDLAPFARAGGSFDAISSSGGGAIDDDDGAAESIASSKPNKGIILTKSVEYIKHLHEVCSSMRGKVIELQHQLDSVRRAVFANNGDIPHADGASIGPSSIGGLQMMQEVHRIRANSGTAGSPSEPYGGLGQTSPDPSQSMLASAQTPMSPT